MVLLFIPMSLSSMILLLRVIFFQGLHLLLRLALCQVFSLSRIVAPLMLPYLTAQALHCHCLRLLCLRLPAPCLLLIVLRLLITPVWRCARN